jgi:hypothetical protein
MAHDKWCEGWSVHIHMTMEHDQEHKRIKRTRGKEEKKQRIKLKANI